MKWSWLSAQSDLPCSHSKGGSQIPKTVNQGGWYRRVSSKFNFFSNNKQSYHNHTTPSPQPHHTITTNHTTNHTTTTPPTTPPQAPQPHRHKHHNHTATSITTPPPQASQPHRHKHHNHTATSITTPPPQAP